MWGAVLIALLVAVGGVGELPKKLDEELVVLDLMASPVQMEPKGGAVTGCTLAVDAKGVLYACWRLTTEDHDEIRFSTTTSHPGRKIAVRTMAQGSMVSEPAMWVRPSGTAAIVWHDMTDKTIIVKHVESGRRDEQLSVDTAAAHVQMLTVIANDSHTNVFWVAQDKVDDLFILVNGELVVPFFALRKAALYQCVIREETVKTKRIQELSPPFDFANCAVARSPDGRVRLMVSTIPREPSPSLSEIDEYMLSPEGERHEVETTPYVGSNIGDLWTGCLQDGRSVCVFEEVHWNTGESNVLVGVKDSDEWAEPFGLLVRRGPAVMKPWLASLVQSQGRLLLVVAYFHRTSKQLKLAIFDTKSDRISRCSVDFPAPPVAMVGDKNGRLHFAYKDETGSLMYVPAKLRRGVQTVLPSVTITAPAPSTE